MAGVTLSQVRKNYGNLEVIHGIDLEVHSGEFLVLVGPSGCGKSTLLRMIAGLEEITDGTIAIGDRIVNDVPASQRNLSMVFQSYALYPHMSVRRNLAFGLTNLRMPKPEIERRVAEASRILQIGELMERKPRQLSGGQKQRVAIGRAIVREPQLFLFDEPLSNLDAELRVQMRVELAGLYQRLGTTMIYVTHDQVEAMTMATRIAVLNAGSRRAGRDALRALQLPAQPVRRDLHRLAQDEPDRARANGALPDFGTLPRAAEAATIGVRPEQFAPSAATATHRRRHRASSNISAARSFSTCAWKPARPSWCRRPGNSGVRIGDRIAVSFKPETAHYFDAKGRRVPRRRKRYAIGHETRT